MTSATTTPLISLETTFASRSDFQWWRKVLHVANGTTGFCVYNFSGLSEPWIWFVLGCCTFVSLIIDLMRIMTPSFMAKYGRVLKPLIRHEEIFRLSSATRGLGASLIAQIICPRAVDIIVILFLTFGDTMGGIIGSFFGRKKINKHTSVNGFLAVWVTCSLSVFVILTTFYSVEINSLLFWMVVFLGGGIGAFSEGFFPKHDDNVTIPIVSSALLWVLFLITMPQIL